MKEFLSKYKLHVLVVLVGVVGLLWLNGTLKGCDVETLSVNSTSSTSETTVQPASTPTTTATTESIGSHNTEPTTDFNNAGTSSNTEDEPPPASENVVTKEGSEN